MNNKLMAIYERLPLPIKTLAVTFLGYTNQKRRKSKDFDLYRERFRKIYDQGLDAIIAYQKEGLRTLFDEASKNSGYFKKIFSEAGIDEFSIRNTDPHELIYRLPLLEKKFIKDDLEHFCNIGRETAEVSFTSGTTGTPMKVYHDRESVNITYAVWRSFHDKIGLPEKIRSIRFSGNKIIPLSRTKAPFWVEDLSSRQLFMSTYHMNDENIPAYLEKIRSFQPHLLDGYPSALFVLASHILKHNFDLGYQPMAIVTTCETLYPDQKEIIGRAFGCHVYNQYAASEGVPFITECPEGNLHMHLESGYFEVLDDDGREVGSGEVGELVVTSLRNFKTPLIRYKTGDKVRRAEHSGPCACGMPTPYLAEIMGRDDDILVASNGALVGMGPYRIFKYTRNIKLAKIIQDTPDSVELLICKEPEYNAADEALAIERTRFVLGADMQVKITYVEDIPKGKTGKLKASQRNFPLTSLK
jgi:phenylacetate-CoA ligase